MRWLPTLSGVLFPVVGCQWPGSQISSEILDLRERIAQCEADASTLSTEANSQKASRVQLGEPDSMK